MGLVAAFAVYTILLYYGASILGQHSSALRAISLSFAILAVIISFYAIIEFIIKENVLFAALVAEKAPVKSAEFYRSGSTLGQPLVLGAFLITVMPLQIYFYFREKFLFRHVFWSLSIILSAAALVISFSKGSWITG